MKLTKKQLRELINEVLMSPALKKEKTLDSPLDNKSINEALGKLKNEFFRVLEKDMILRSFSGHWNPETRDFDDKAYEYIKKVAEAATKQMVGRVVDVLEKSWRSGEAAIQKKGESGEKKVA